MNIYFVFWKRQYNKKDKLPKRPPQWLEVVRYFLLYETIKIKKREAWIKCPPFFVKCTRFPIGKIVLHKGIIYRVFRL